MMMMRMTSSSLKFASDMFEGRPQGREPGLSSGGGGTGGGGGRREGGEEQEVCEEVLVRTSILSLWNLLNVIINTVI